MFNRKRMCLFSLSSQKRLNALEEQHSLLKNELVAKGAALEKSQLDGELVKQEKYELSLALEQVHLYPHFLAQFKLKNPPQTDTRMFSKAMSSSFSF